MHLPQFVYSNEHLGCFQFLLIMNKAAFNSRMQFSHGHKLSNQLGKFSNC